MDSKIIFIDFEGAVNRGEGGDVRGGGGESVCMCVCVCVCVCVLRLGCVSQGQYNRPRPQLFVPVHTLKTHPVPLLFIYISAWMGERRTLTQKETERERGFFH